MEWRTIETAPKDGTQILAFDGSDMVIVEYHQRKDGSAFWEIAHDPMGRLYVRRCLTHWMPLPKPPAKAGEAP